MRKQRFISLSLAFMMVFTTVFSAVGVEAAEFVDMPTNWAKEPIEKAINNGLLKGSNNKVNPKGNLTRAELVTILNRALGTRAKADISSFSDLSKDNWYYTEFQKAVKANLVEGSGSKMNPNNPITREEAFVILGRAFDIGETTNRLSEFKDASKVSKWAVDNINGLIANGYLKGSSGKLNPKGYITRAEYASIMNELVPTYDKDLKGLDKTIKGNLLVKSADTILRGLKIEGDLILSEALANKKISLDGVEVKGRILVRGSGEVQLINGSKAERLVVQNPESTTKVNISKDSTIQYADLKSKTDLVGEGRVKQVYLHKGSDLSTIKTKGTKIDATEGGIKYTDETKDKPEEVVTLPPASGGDSTGGTVTPKPEDKDTITIKPDKDGKATISGNHKNVILDGTFSEIVVNTTSNFKLNIPENHTGDIDVIKGEGLKETGKMDIAKGTQAISITLDEKHGKVTITKDGFKMSDSKTEYVGVIEFDIRDTEGNPIEGARVSLTHFEGNEATEDDYGVNGKGTIFYSKKGYYNYTVIAPGYFGASMTSYFEIEDMESLIRIVELEKLPVIEPYMHFQKAVIDLDKLETITLENKAEVKKARSLYDELDESQKEKVENKYIEKLKALEEKLTSLEKDEEEKLTRIKAVEEKITNLPSLEELTLENKEEVEEARVELDKLAEEKVLVKKELVEKLVALEGKLVELEDLANEEAKKEVEEKLNQVLSASKDYKYDPVYNYNYNKFEIVEDTAELEYKDIAVENAKVVMNDLARYLGAMYRIDNGATVKSIEYKGQVYTWNGELKGSNWKNETSTLIKVITDDFKENKELRELNLKLVGDLGVEKTVTIKGKLVTDLTPLEPALKVVTVKNEFEVTDVENLRFMVKSITNDKGGQKVAILEEVNTHFNKNYGVKDGYKLEVEVNDENITFKTYMTEELFAEIKGKDGANLETPYKITVLKGENKKEDKIIKLAYTKEDVTFIYVAVEDLEKLIINDLPSLEELTLENKDKVEEARAAYKALGEGKQDLVKKELVEKLVALEKRIEELEKEKALKEVTVKNEFEVTDVENLRFMVKSITNDKGGQKVATLEEVNTHFNNNYDVKNGYKLEVELVEGNLVLKTYMTEELFAEIKGKDGADSTTPYRITVLKGENKKEDKIIKLAYTKEDVTFIYVAVEDLEKLIINDLPSLEELTLENKDKVEEARAAYKALGKEKQDLVKEELVEKLVALEGKLVELEKEKALKVVKVKNEFEVTDVENLRFMVKSITSDKGGQKVATLEEVNDHFNSNYEVKDGYKLEVELVEGNLVLKTYMIEELFAEIKGKDGADSETPYRITVLKGENKKEDKIIKLAYTKEDVTFIYVAVEDLEKLIAELPEVGKVSLENKEKVVEARAAYEALGEKKQALVKKELVEKLVALEGKLVELEKDLANEEAKGELESSFIEAAKTQESLDKTLYDLNFDGENANILFKELTEENGIEVVKKAAEAMFDEIFKKDIVDKIVVKVGDKTVEITKEDKKVMDLAMLFLDGMNPDDFLYSEKGTSTEFSLVISKGEVIGNIAGLKAAFKMETPLIKEPEVKPEDKLVEDFIEAAKTQESLDKTLYDLSFDGTKANIVFVESALTNEPIKTVNSAAKAMFEKIFEVVDILEVTVGEKTVAVEKDGDAFQLGKLFLDNMNVEDFTKNGNAETTFSVKIGKGEVKNVVIEGLIANFSIKLDVTNGKKTTEEN